MVRKNFLLNNLQIRPQKIISWQKKCGKINCHNGKIPRDFWLEDWEKEEIVKFYCQNAREGYRRIAYMLLDEGNVCVSPATVYRVLKNSGVMRAWNRKSSSKGTDFVQPLRSILKMWFGFPKSPQN